VDASIVATPVVALAHVPPATVEAKVVVVLSHKVVVPLNVPALGAAVTVASLVSVAFEQPPLPETVYVITDVPADTPVTTPVDAWIVATPIVALAHVPPATVEAKVVVVLSHNASVPLNVPALGDAVTVTVLVAETSAQPPLPDTV